MRLTNLLLSSTLALSIVACRGGGGGDDTPGDDTPTPDSQPPGGDVTIQEVQNDAMPVGTQVSVKGVVVTAIDTYGNRTGDFFVQDPAGGPFSGVKVFGASLDQVAAIAVGDIVDITNAEKDEFALTSDITGRKVTELKPAAGGAMVITKKGTGTVPAPAAVDAKALAALDRAARETEWEKWEGVLITVTGARQIAATRAFGSNPGPDSNEFRITGFARVQSVLAELSSDAAFGVCYTSITGLGDYFFNDLVLPRSADDLVIGGTDCLPMAETVTAVQSASTTPEVVSLTNAFVTAVDDVGSSKGFWVADALQGAANNGVYVFIGGNSTTPGTIPTGVVVGARVNVVGGVDEFDLGSMGNPPVGDTVTEIVSPVVSNIQAPAGLPTPATAASVEVLSDIGATGEPWEGVLVQIGPVKVTNVNAGQGKVELTDNNNKKILADDESFVFNPTTGSTITLGACYSTFTGVMHVQINDDVRTINPRSLADIVTSANPGACTGE